MEKDIEKLAKALGLDVENTNKSDVISACIDKIQEANNLKGVTNALKEKLKKTQNNVNLAIQASEQQQINTLVDEVQDETGYRVGNEHIKKLKQMAKKVVNTNDDEKKTMAKENMETYCYAYGEEVNLSEKLDELLSGSEPVNKHDEEPSGDWHYLAEQYKAYQEENGEQISLKDAINYVIQHTDQVKEKLNINTD